MSNFFVVWKKITIKENYKNQLSNFFLLFTIKSIMEKEISGLQIFYIEKMSGKCQLH